MSAKIPTLRQDIIATAARSLHKQGQMTCCPTALDEWLEYSRAAHSVARCRGMSVAAMRADVDAMSWPRLVNAVDRQVARLWKQSQWMDAMSVERTS